MRFARFLEIALGILFIVSAALKALDILSFAMQVSYYNVVRDRMLVQTIAYSMIALEALLGAALIGGFRLRGLTFAATTALLVAFTGLIAYAWMFHGLTDCGCFGEYVKMGPATSIAKNLILLAITLIAWRGLSPKHIDAAAATDEAAGHAPRFRTRPIWAIAGLAVVAIAFAFGKSPQTVNVNPVRPPSETTPPSAASARFSEFSPEQEGLHFSLAEGEFFVAMLSAGCDHCKASVEVLNELATYPDVPQVVGLLMGNEDEVKEFMASTGPTFPTQTIDMLQFMEYIGTAPPRFYIVRDGKDTRHLDPMDPNTKEVRDVTLDELLAFAHSQ